MFRPYLSQSSSGSGRLAGKKSLVKEEVVELCRVCETVENLVDISTESYSHLNEKLHRLANFEMIINTVDPLNADPLGDAATQNYGNVKKEDRWTDDDDSPAEDSDNYFNDTPQDFMEKTEEIKKETVKTNNKKKSSGYTYKPKKRGKMVWTKLPDNYEIIIDKRRRWTCAICGRAFQEKWILKNHIKGLHSSDKPHACDLCDNKYSLKSALKRHKMTHEDAQIPCDVCGKTFRNLLYMKKHRKHNHSGEKPPRPNSGTLICQTCGHVAKNRNTLVAHLRIHAGTKPFKCEVCKRVPAEATAGRS
uniref:C2H2-type domain-containing protein n=1 Tax=Lutzomyia longipalpis TaxID=7200 RepID=A0A1B0CS44_LUTLO